MKTIIILILCAISCSTIAQMKTAPKAKVEVESIAVDSVEIDLTDWQKEQMADLQKKVSELQEAETVLKAQYNLILSAIVDANKIPLSDVHTVNVLKTGKLLVLRKKKK